VRGEIARMRLEIVRVQRYIGRMRGAQARAQSHDAVAQRGSA
jgi:hypothetical protein